MAQAAVALAIFKMLGGFSAAGAAEAVAKARGQGLEFSAEQARINAVQAFAASQRAAISEEHRAALLSSRALAVAGASGGGVSDPTVVRIISDIDTEGAYRAAVALYEGEERARNLRMQAEGLEFEAESVVAAGEAQADAMRLSALGSFGQSMYAKYGRRFDTSASSQLEV